MFTILGVSGLGSHLHRALSESPVFAEAMRAAHAEAESKALAERLLAQHLAAHAATADKEITYGG